MKNRILQLLVLTGVLSTCTVETYAQRGHFGGGGRIGGGGRVMSSPHFSSPRINASPRVYSAPPQRYFRSYSYGGPRVIVHGGIRVGGGYPGYYYYHGPRPYYRYYYPRFGLFVSTLPFGYFSLGPAFGPYFYYGGTYYVQSDNGYRVTEAPDGAMVPDLPADAQEVEVNGQTYYDVNGTYYQEVMTDNGRRYKVVGKGPQQDDNSQQAPADNNSGNVPDDFITQLPEGSRSVNINGQQYYLSPDGMYYQQTTVNGNSGYKVVGKTDAGE
jgi:hypothetical protein